MTSRIKTGRLWPSALPETEFLPAALEIVEQPVSPLPRAVAGAIMLFFVLAVMWSWIGWIDIIATAPGKIIPSGRVKVIQPLEIGTIKAIPVEEGQHVAAGEILLELNPTTNQADRDRFASDLLRARIDVARLRAQLGPRPGDPFAGFGDAEPLLIATARDHQSAEEAEQQAKLQAVDRQLAEKRAEADQVKATLAKLQATLPLVEQRALIRSKSLATGFGSKISFLDAQQTLVELKNESLVQRHRLEQSEQAAAALQHQHEQGEAEYRHRLFGDLAKAETQVAELSQELRKATDKTALQKLTAPVDGIVQQLAVHTIGGVVTPAQELMVIIPSDAELEIEAMIENKDIGFVENGQTAEIKVETFNFTRFGFLHGKVTRVARDTVPTDKTAAGPAQPGTASAESSAPQHLAYVARIALDRASMRIDGKDVPLEPGMAVTVEIKTGERRVFDYLLSPLQSYRHDSLRER